MGRGIGVGIPGAVTLGLAFSFAACDDDGTRVAASSCTTGGPVVEILDNHLPSGGDHALIVPAQDVVAAVETTYDIRGDNVGHTHSVTLTVGDFQALQRGEPVTVISSNNGPVGFGHTHTVELSCP